MRRLFSLAGILALLTAPAFAQEGPSLIEAFRSGSPVADVRLRGERVSTEALDDVSTALTVRAALGYRTGSFRGLSAFVESEIVGAPLGDDNYANAGFGSLKNSVVGRPVIADPVGAEVNQAYLRLNRSNVTMTIGRQEIVLSDARFVGNVGWRQNHQSYDGVRIDAQPTAKVSGTYAFLREAHRITGQDLAMRSHVAEGVLSIGSIGTARAFAFLLDYPDNPTASRATFGARVEGRRVVSESMTGVFDVSFATQSQAFDNPEDVSAHYLNLTAGLNADRFGISAGYELLSGSSVDGTFATPLATLHKFNGWADQFLGTPANGLADLHLGLSAVHNGIRAAVVFHDFSSEGGGEHFGREVDVQITYALEDGPAFGAKLAHYMADDWRSDLTKVWVWTTIGL